ncbi:hypothetical protein MKX03_009083 [Papaver bracteatum]|nr:hypothetical protein MKX03_009083 [Papaver bracteatum]
MAEIRSLIISCVFVFVLFATSTVMCTVEGEKCHLVITDAVLAGAVEKISSGTIVNTAVVCSATLVICDSYCSLQKALLGKLIKGGEVGKCIYPNVDALGSGYCACCQLN